MSTAPPTPPPTYYPPPQPPPKRPSWPRRHPVITGLIAVSVGVLIGAIIMGTGDSMTPATSPTTPGVAATSSAAPTPSALTETQRLYVSDMRAKYGFQSNVSDQNIVSFGQSICQGRQGGGSQSQAEHLAKTTWTHESGTDAYKMARLAETDLCASELPPVRWHTLAVYTGSGLWNSPTFRIHPGPSALRVSYSYSGNSMGFGGDNFAADLVSSSDDMQLANDIAVSGSHSSMEYPDLSFGGSRSYHLAIEAADSSCTWRFVIQQRW